MRILSIESSAFPASAAILDDGKITAEFYINTSFTHSQTLMPMVKSVLELTKTDIKDIDLIAVDNGPGSFTGVRIGVASAKGLAFPNHTDCLGISSLEALACNLFDDRGTKRIYACIDARVKQQYNAVFILSDGKLTRITEDRVITNEDLIAEIRGLDTNEEIWLVGDYAVKMSELLGDDSRLHVAPENIRYQKASSVAFAAYLRSLKGEKQTAQALQPVYLQLPQATRELNSRLSSAKGM